MLVEVQLQLQSAVVFITMYATPQLQSIQVMTFRRAFLRELANTILTFRTSINWFQGKSENSVDAMILLRNEPDEHLLKTLLVGDRPA